MFTLGTLSLLLSSLLQILLVSTVRRIAIFTTAGVALLLCWSSRHMVVLVLTMEAGAVVAAAAGVGVALLPVHLPNPEPQSNTLSSNPKP